MNEKNTAYTAFASVYDLFMEDIPYDAWFRQTVEILEELGIREGIICDLGCGTGTLTRKMAAAGYDMIGIDASFEMLGNALAKKRNGEPDILYLCQDIRAFELYGTCAAMICRCDTINYILDLEELVQVFSLVNLYLDPGGVFIFDCNTPYKYREILGDNVFAENREEGSFIWENHFDEDSGINEYDLTLFIPDAEGSTKFERVDEYHMQKAFGLSQLRYACEKSGMRWGTVLDADTEKEPGPTTERYLITLFEQGKADQGKAKQEKAEQEKGNEGHEKS